MQSSYLTLSMGAGIKVMRYTIDYNDLTDNDTSQTITLDTLYPDDIVMGTRIKHSTAFSGGTINAMTVSVDGSVDGVAAYGTAFDIYQAVADTTLQLSQCFKNGTGAAAGQTLQATFTSTAGNVTAATAGQVDIDVVLLAVTKSTTQ